MVRRTGRLPDDFPEVDALRGAGVDTYGALAAKSDEELVAEVKGLGKAKLREVRVAGAQTDEALAEASGEEANQLVRVRVTRARYYRHGQQFGKGAELVVPKHALEFDQENNRPPFLEQVKDTEE